MRTLGVLLAGVAGAAAIAAVLATWRAHAETVATTTISAITAVTASTVPARDAGSFAGQTTALEPSRPPVRHAGAAVDPFYPAQRAAQPEAVAAPAVAPPPPQAPVFGYRFFGRVVAPAAPDEPAAPGEPAPAGGRDAPAEAIYLERDERLVKAEPGKELADGFRIEAVSATQITVSHPLLAEPLRVQLPAAAATP